MVASCDRLIFQRIHESSGIISNTHSSSHYHHGSGGISHNGNGSNTPFQGKIK